VPLKKLLLKPGVNKENTRYTNENGWYISDKVRFRQGTPEKIGGWVRISAFTFLGICRSLWNWTTLQAQNLLGVGTNLKYYIEQGGLYNDITPIRTRNYSATLTNPFDTTNTSTAVDVNDTAHGAQAGDLVYFTGASAVGGVPAAELNTRHVITSITNANKYVITVTTAATSTVTGGGGTVTAQYYLDAFLLGTDPFAVTNTSTTVVVTHSNHGATNGSFVTFSGATGPIGGIPASEFNTEHQLTYLSTNTYSITVTTPATSTTTGGGSAVYAEYQVNAGPAVQVPLTGWGSGPWGLGPWGSGVSATDSLRLWSANNFGEDLVYGPRGGGVYYWDATNGVTTRGVNIVTLPGALDPPVVQTFILVSDTYRFVICFGANDVGTTIQDPMLIRWSDQESVVDWAPAVTSQAGSIRLSTGSEIVTALQTRQEIVVWTDSALYSLQYVGPPDVWTAQLLGDNISIVGQNAKAVASGRVYWMGVDKFYVYDGRVQTLRCDLRRHVFSNINLAQNQQVFAGTNEGFNEVWWFYCSADSTVVDSYVVYNYLEDIWYYGSLGRTAWTDSGLRDYPQAATYSYNLVSHELGVDDGTTGTLEPIVAYIESAELDIEDGQNFGFVWRMVPDVTFQGSSAASPQLTMTLYGMNGSGSGFNQTASKGVTRTSTAVIEQFTNIIYTRIRGRQMIMKAQSDGLGVTWQLGAPRIDVNIDGQR
jgi:hypothetical protein